jgi:hypothetical protein
MSLAVKLQWQFQRPLPKLLAVMNVLTELHIKPATATTMVMWKRRIGLSFLNKWLGNDQRPLI